MTSLPTQAVILFALLLSAATGVNSVAAFVATIRNGDLVQTPMGHRHDHDFFVTSPASESDGADCNESAPSLANTRRRWIRSLAAPAASAAFFLCKESASASDEEKCDLGDVRCRQKAYDRYMDSFQEVRDQPSGQPIPAVTNRITYVAQMIIDIGERRDGDAGYLRFGLYGDDCPGSVKQMLLFLTRGITSMDQEALEDRLEIDYVPVSLGDGNGSVQSICPGKGIDFGVPSQSRAYSKGRGMRSAGPNFVPQGRPPPTPEGEAFPRPHGVAGLVSVPAKGIGYGNHFELDEIYSSAFTITADAAPALDEPNSARQQRVIGQIIDNESMRFLDRLASLPVQKRLGKSDSGPPLLKVRVRDVDVQKVK